MLAETRMYPTAVRLPMWARTVGLRSALSTLRISQPSVSKISDRFSLDNLLESFLRPDLPKALNPSDYLSAIRGLAPVDGSEIVSWMQISAAENVVMQARIREYNLSGSRMEGQSGDPYIPGVIVGDSRLRSERGSRLSRRGFGIADTPRGRFDFPNLEGRPGIFRDIIEWASSSWVGRIQWVGNLLKWLTLSETPIRDAIGFFMDRRENVAPNFFVQMPSRPALTVHVRQRFSSDDAQTLSLNFRAPSNYTNVRGSKSASIDAGESQVEYDLSAFPYVPPLVAEIQPENGRETVLEEYVVV